MYPMRMPIYQSSEIREFEQLAKERFNLSDEILMQRAGKAAFDFLLRRFPQAQKIAVFCVKGNNGGDGYTLAKLLHERGLHVDVWQVGNHESLKSPAEEAMRACQKAHVPVYPFTEKSDLHHPDLIVDALCGIGVHTTLKSEMVTAIEKIKRLQVPIYALDIPSGVDADTGCVLGDALPATVTMTMIGLKLGLLTGHGIAYTGELVLNDLQLPPELFSFIEPVAEKIHLGAFLPYLKPRPRDWHKRLSGHVCIVGGALGFGGAVRMAAIAALRVGAGLVTIATYPEHANMMNINCPEVMSHAVATPADLQPLFKRADVVVLGPGLSTSDWGKTLWDFTQTIDLPLVMDADGLNLLAETPLIKENWILTPHPGEAARLLNTTSDEIQANRLDALKAIQKQYGGVCVLKGAGTLILAPHTPPALCDKGNPGMATAGMGDILSGILGGLVAQVIPLSEASKMGVMLHALAGDLAAKDGERGMIATDLMPYLRRLVNEGK